MSQKEGKVDYSNLLKATKDGFMIEEDLKTIGRINKTLENLSEFRENKINESRKVLQSMYIESTAIKYLLN